MPPFYILFYILSWNLCILVRNIFLNVFYILVWNMYI